MESWILNILNRDGELVKFYPYISKPDYYIECWIICKPFPKRLAAGSRNNINIKLLAKDSAEVADYETTTISGLNKIVFVDDGILDLQSHDVVENNSKWLTDVEEKTTSKLDRKDFTNNYYFQEFDYDLITVFSGIVVSPVVITQSGLEISMAQEEPQTGAVIHYEKGGDVVPDYISYWKFDGNTNNETGNNNAINRDGISISGVTEKPNTAYSFDSNSANNIPMYVNSSDVFNIGTGDFSISVWVKGARQSKNYPTIIGNDNPGGFHSGTSAFGIRLSNVGREGRVTFHWKAVGDPALQSNNNNYNGQFWNHVVIVREGTNLTQTINKVDISTRTINQSSSINLSSGDLTFGGSFDGSNGKFTGGVDSPRVYNRALTASEIDIIYNAELNGLQEPPKDPTEESPTYIAPITSTVGTRFRAGAVVNGAWSPYTDYEVM